MKMHQIASASVHHTMPQVPEQPAILAAIVSQVRDAMGHGVSWKSGAAYLTLSDFSTLAVPRRQLNSTLQRLGSHVLRVH